MDTNQDLFSKIRPPFSIFQKGQGRNYVFFTEFSYTLFTKTFWARRKNGLMRKTS